MDAIDYTRVDDVAAALRAAQQPGAVFIGGGTNLLDLMKGGVAHASMLVDINRLPLDKIEAVDGGGLRLGALVRNSDAAVDARVRERYPLLSQALLAGASPQLRNMATVGGNLLQRTRCHYFVDVAFEACNKRRPGSGCAARGGRNRNHAILGTSEHCIATNPSDMSVALAALEAVVIVQGTKGERRIAFEDFHRLPGDTPQRDSNLAPGELIVGVELPANGFAANSHYLKVRDRASYAFALVSVAAALDLQDGHVRTARIALGGVAHKPWRARAAEKLLLGKALDDAALAHAGAAAIEGAQAYGENAFKLSLAPAAVARALRIAGGAA